MYTECFLISFIIDSCCTLRLNLFRAVSIDSPSSTTTNANKFTSLSQGTRFITYLDLNVNPEEIFTPGFVLTTFVPCAIRGIIHYERALLRFTEEKKMKEKRG
jgi:hypothetical protein